MLHEERAGIALSLAKYTCVWYSLSSREKIGVACLGAVVVAAAAWVGVQKLTVPRSFQPTITAEAANGGQFPVYVAGAVREPAVISATANMLVNDAIQEAGGATKDADTGKLNLAARLVPNSRLYVPKLGEDLSAEELGPYAPGAAYVPAPAQGYSTGRSRGAAQSSGGIVNINTASEQELDTLPGVGPVTAKRIIEYRNQVGGFRSIDQLLDVKGIGPKKLERMRSRVTT